MAAGNYQVDLTVINLAETNTGWNDINQAGGGGANTAEVDFAIQGTNAITRQVSNTRRGVLYDFGSPVTLGADDHIYTWTVCSTPGIVDNKSLGGIRVSVGTSTTAYYDFYTNGGDTLPEGGMNNYVVYYAAASASLTNGSPGANPQFFGAQASTNATARNVNFACDAIRYGTGYYIFDGDSTNPITFASASQDNDLNANRYGVFTAIPGGFSQKGRFVIGQTTASVATQAYFDDANTTVQFADTEFAQPDFTQIRIDHPSTFANFRNITFLGLGTKNPGQFNFLDSSTVGYLDGCTFNSIGTTQLQAAVTASSTWLGCSTVDQSGSLINASNFTNTNAPVSALVSDRPDRVTNCTFTSAGTKHGIEVTAAGSYVFTGNTLTGFDSGSNANEFLYFNPTGGTGDLTLTVVSGNGTIEFRNASSGTVTIVNSVTVTLTGLKDNTEVRVFEGTNSYPQTELAGIENATDGTTDDRSFSFSLEIGTVVDIVIHNKNYKYLRIEDFELTETQDLPVTQIFDRNYDNVGGETVYLSDPYFTSLAARSTFYEDAVEPDSKVFTQYLEAQGLWESASFVYVPPGYSSRTVHTLVPSSSTFDLDLVDNGDASADDISSDIVARINSDGYVVTASAANIPMIHYNPTSTGGVSGSLAAYRRTTLLTVNPINFAINPSGDLVFATGDLISSSNSTLTFPIAGVISPQNIQNATELKDNNVGGSQEIYFQYPNTGVSPSTGTPTTFTVFVKEGGAQYFYISGSDFGGTQDFSAWFDVTNGVTGSFGGSAYNLHTIQGYRNGWYKVAVGTFINAQTGTRTVTFGISDSDGGKTVTSDGTANIYLFGLNSAQGGLTPSSRDNITYLNSSSLASGDTNHGKFTGSLNTDIDSTDFSWFIECSKYVYPYTSITGSYVEISEIFRMDSTTNPTGTRVFVNHSTVPGSDRISVVGNINGSFVQSGGNKDFTAGLDREPSKNGKFIRLGGRVRSGDSKYYINGELQYSSTATFSTSDIFDRIQFFSSGTRREGRIRRFAIFSPGLTDSELQALTNSGSYS